MLFILIALTIYLGANGWVYYHAHMALQGWPTGLRIGFGLLFWAVALSFILFMYMRGRHLTPLAGHWFYQISTGWLVALLYLTLLLLAGQLPRLAGIHIDDGAAALPDGYKGRFSRTCYATADLPAMKKKAEYVFLANAFSRGGMERAALEEAARQGLIDKHVYALGGVSLDNIGLARELGFGGVVVCEDVWDKFDIHNELDYKDLISHFEKLRKAVS